MKNINLILILCVLVFSSFGIAKAELNWKPTTTQELSNKANKTGSVSSPYGAVLNDPIINSALGGYKNMIEGSTGASFNPIEQQKIQKDYARQQSEYYENEEE